MSTNHVKGISHNSITKNCIRLVRRIMDPNILAEILKSCFRSREVKSLMGLTGRLSWVLALVAITTIYTAGREQSLSPERQSVLIYCGIAWLFLHLLSYFLGMLWPDRFHYGADQLLEIRRMQMGDSIAGKATISGQTESH